ncbi:MAG: hypothetical protein ACKOYN_00510 [Planctomycetota bacterium]
MRSTLAVAALAASISSASLAEVYVFGTQFVYENYLLGVGAVSQTENFNGFGGFYSSPLTGNLSSIGVNWSANAVGGIYVGPAAGSQVLSTNNPVSLSVSFTGTDVRGFSGNIFGTDINFNLIPAVMQIQLQDGSSYFAYVDATTAWVGLYSTTAAITNVTISAQPAPGGAQSVYPTLDNMNIAVIPAPGALALLAVAGMIGRRRR